jgi:hypothetical protein
LELPQIIKQSRTGAEPLHSDGQNLGVSVIDFWRWSASDLLSNATRGRFAEFVVARALDIPLDEVRDEWGAYDLLGPEGIRVEVKSAAYIQSWHQSKPSIISFRVPKTRAWNAETNVQEIEARRQADVYVFALLAHSDQATIDPLNVSQWHFFVLPTVVLDSRTRSQHSITLPTLVQRFKQRLHRAELASNNPVQRNAQGKCLICP